MIIREPLKNDDRDKTKKSIHNRPFGYQGQNGLEIAKDELRIFKGKYNRLPKANEFGGIKKAILRGEYHQFSINSWNDLLRTTFGEITVEREIYTPNNEGLRRAIVELLRLKKESGKLPAANDKKCSAIHKAIYRKKWVAFGIYKWNDLMKMTFGRVHGQIPKYTADEQGLRNAINTLHMFNIQRGLLPKSSDKEMSTIKSGISRKRWTQFGIKSWHDLMRKAFGINRENKIKIKDK